MSVELEVLDPDSIEAFLHLVPPDGRSTLRRFHLSNPEQIFALGARSNGQPEGLMVTRWTPSGVGVLLLGVWTGPSAHFEEDGATLLRAGERHLLELGCRQIQATLDLRRASSSGLAGALERAGFARLDLAVSTGRLSRSKLESAPWYRRLRVPRAFEIVPWPKLLQEEKQSILSHQIRTPGFSHGPVEPHISLGLRCRGRLIGWHLSHVVGTDRVAHEAAYVPAEYVAAGLHYGLMGEMFRRLFEHLPQVRYSDTEVLLENEAHLDILHRWVAPYFDDYRLYHAVDYVKLLGESRKPSGEGGPVARDAAPPTWTKNPPWRHVYSTRSEVQHIDFRADKRGFFLLLNGTPGFHSADAAAYHETLVHPAMITHRGPRAVVVLGGGDGLALCEVLRYPRVERVVVVEIDPTLVRMACEYLPLAKLNEHAFGDPRVSVVNEDPGPWAAGATSEQFDVVLVDLAVVDETDPTSEFVRRLTVGLERLLRGDGVASIPCASLPGVSQPTKSPADAGATSAAEQILAVLQESRLHVRPYRARLPGRGEWQFALARPGPFESPRQVPMTLRYLDDRVLRAAFDATAAQ